LTYHSYKNNQEKKPITKHNKTVGAILGKIEKSIFLVIFLSLLVSCKEASKTQEPEDKDSNKIVIDLKNTSDKLFSFEPVFSESPVYSLEKKYPEYYDKKLQKFKGLPSVDSFRIVSKNFQLKPFIQNLYEDGFIRKGKALETMGESEFENLSARVDTLDFQLNIFSGFKGNKQLIIADLDHDNNFANDETLEFQIDYRSKKHIEQNENIPVLHLPYEVFLNDEIYSLKRDIKIYPETKHPHIYLFEDNVLDDTTNEYTVMLKFVGYKKGEHQLNDMAYSFGVQGLFGEFVRLKIIPNSITNPKSRKSDNFLYSISDTLRAGNNFYEIESVSGDLAKLTLKKIDVDTDKFTGYRIGDKIDNYNLLTLESKKVNLLESINKNKPYTLLDFWGTWCAPCIKGLPELKGFHNEFSEKVNLMSFALDKNISDVKEFSIKNNMSWQHFFINSNNRKGSIIAGMNITKYPTFILLNEDFEIIYEGNSGSLAEIKKLIEY